jgi:hypothetical protein
MEANLMLFQPDGSWTTEIVRNDNVISAYVARRVEIEEENMRAEDYVPTGDVVKDQRMKAKCVDSPTLTVNWSDAHEPCSDFWNN